VFHVKQQPDKQRARIVVIANQKGGVGKTTTAVNIAGEYARRGRETLLIDLDPQGNATTSLGLSKPDLVATTYDLLMGHVPAADAVITSGRPSLDVIATDQELAGAAVELSSSERRERRLRERLQPLMHHYDRVVIDCPPSLGLLTLNALCAADDVIIPLQCEYLALEGLAQLKTTIDRVRERLNPQLRLLGVVMTMFDGRTNLAQQVVEEVQRHFPRQIFRTLIPRSIRLSEAPSYGQLAAEYEPGGRGTVAYGTLMDEIAAREEATR
jgi:chromosome partitioning protein